MEQDSCQECDSRPAVYCLAWDQLLCENCRRRRTDHEVKDGGSHPVWDLCSCQKCKKARKRGITDGTWKPWRLRLGARTGQGDAEALGELAPGGVGAVLVGQSAVTPARRQVAVLLSSAASRAIGVIAGWIVYLLVALRQLPPWAGRICGV
jgi:hypothetical protein